MRRARVDLTNDGEKERIDIAITERIER